MAIPGLGRILTKEKNVFAIKKESKKFPQLLENLEK